MEDRKVWAGHKKTRKDRKAWFFGGYQIYISICNVCVYIYIYMYVLYCMYVCMYVCMYMYMYIYIYMYI